MAREVIAMEKDGEARDAGSSFLRSAQALLSMELPADSELRSELAALGLEPTGAQALLFVQFRKALEGDNSAAKFVRDAAGELAAAEGDGAAAFRGMSDAELRAMAAGAGAPMAQ